MAVVLPGLAVVTIQRLRSLLPLHLPVKSRDILYIKSLDILYIGGEELGLGIQRSMIFERWIPGSSSRIRVVQ
jgi:hypothetical protein